MTDIIRYDIVHYTSDDNTQSEMEFREAGEYITYEDHSKKVSVLSEELVDLLDKCEDIENDYTLLSEKYQDVLARNEYHLVEDLRKELKDAKDRIEGILSGDVLT